MNQITIGLDKTKNGLYTHTNRHCGNSSSSWNERNDTNKKYMLSKANILKKFRRWLRQGEARRIIPSRDNLSIQVGKLLSTRGSELITMTTL